MMILEQENHFFGDEKNRIFLIFVDFPNKTPSIDEIHGRVKGSVYLSLRVQNQYYRYLNSSPSFKEHSQNNCGCMGGYHIMILEQENHFFEDEQKSIFLDFLGFFKKSTFNR